MDTAGKVTVADPQVREHVKRVVAEAPKLTPEMAARICALLRGPSTRKVA